MNRAKRRLKALARRLAARPPGLPRDFRAGRPWGVYGFAVDPPQIKDRLTFTSIALNEPAIEGLKDINNPAGLAGVVLAIAYLRDGALEVIGSAVMVAPAIALTATHNLADRIQALMAEHQIPACFAIGSYGLESWDIKKINFVPGSDVTILGLIPRFPLPKNQKLYTVQMTTRFPRLGERVEIYGFRASAPEFAVSGNFATATIRCLISVGLVTAVYPEKRDSVMLPWPCFEVDCASLGGMSGGPVFDESGHLIGVLTSSFGGDQSGPSYVSMITRALGTRFESAWPKGLLEHRRCLLEINPLLRTIHGEHALRIVEVRGDSVIVHHEQWT